MNQRKESICYHILDPTGNITALVETNTEISRQPYIAEKIMHKHPEVEQTGFISFAGDGDDPVPVCLRMAGGEFCGNASMSAAVLFFQRQKTEASSEQRILLRASGAKEPVPVLLKREEDGTCSACVEMPEAIETVTVSLDYEGTCGALPLVRMQGISHLIIEERSAFYSLKKDPVRAERAVKEWSETLSEEALGLLFLSGSGTRFSLIPLVYVSGSGTLFWEHSCASGSCACGNWLIKKDGYKGELTLCEPGGAITVKTDDKNRICICGRVRLLGSYLL